MEVISLVENTGLRNRKDLRTESGLSLFIRSKDQQILFDTGISGNFHLNAQKLDVNTARVTLAVISHHHFDHGGGLATFLEANNQANEYLRNSSTEQFYLDIFGLLRRRIGLDETLFQLHPQRFAFVSQYSEIAPDVFILTKMSKRHTMPKGNRHLFIGTGSSKRLDDFEHELILVIRRSTGLVVFTGCSHHGILNMLDAVLEHFPGQTINAVFGGFHLIDLPLIYSMAGSKADVEELGQAILKYPIEKIYTGHCTGIKAYRIQRSYGCKTGVLCHWRQDRGIGKLPNKRTDCVKTQRGKTVYMVAKKTPGDELGVFAFLVHYKIDGVVIKPQIQTQTRRVIHANGGHTCREDATRKFEIGKTSAGYWLTRIDAEVRSNKPADPS